MVNGRVNTVVPMVIGRIFYLEAHGLSVKYLLVNTKRADRSPLVQHLVTALPKRIPADFFDELRIDVLNLKIL